MEEQLEGVDLVEVVRVGQDLKCTGCRYQWCREEGSKNECPNCKKPFYNILEYQYPFMAMPELVSAELVGQDETTFTFYVTFRDQEGDWYGFNTVVGKGDTTRL